MKWEGQEQSTNVEDRRSGGGRLPRLGGRGLGLGSIVIAVVVGWIFGINPLTVLGLLGGMGGQAEVTQQAPAQRPPADDRAAAFVSTVLRDTEQVWGRQFQGLGQTYQEPRLVLYRGAISSACGMGQAAMGPFYCPGDRKVYLDLEFFDTLQRQLGAPGEFAQAYVIAHEVGHHVQNQLGITDKVDALRGRVSTTQMNAISVRVELQADCLAGLWAHDSQAGRGWLERGNIESAVNAAARIGDDTLQREAGARVRPESFTHGSSAQRVRWFQRGLEQGRIAACDTLQARDL